jgi:uncharacterized repeat protein (TIGR01451 family)
MKKMTILLLALLMVVGISSIAKAQSPANSLISNIASITAANTTSRDSYYTNLRVARIYGISMNLIGGSYTNTIGTTGPSVHVLRVSNYGNTNSALTIQVRASEIWSNSSVTWTHTLKDAAGTSGTSIDTPLLTPGGTTTVTLTFALGGTATNNTVYRARVVAFPADPAPNNTAYTGDNGVLYGGRMGFDWNDSTATPINPTTGKTTYVNMLVGPAPADGYLTAVVSGPVLQIVKSIDSVTVDGTAETVGLARPGATIVYNIWATNSGSAAATDAAIRDVLPTNVTLVGYDDSASSFKWESTAGLTMTFTNSSFNINDSVNIKVTVTVD